MIFKRAKLNDPQGAAQIKNRSLADILPDLKIASQRPESLVNNIRHYRDITNWTGYQLWLHDIHDS